jgi:hypothetical protein
MNDQSALEIYEDFNMIKIDEVFDACKETIEQLRWRHEGLDIESMLNDEYRSSFTAEALQMFLKRLGSQSTVKEYEMLAKFYDWN